MAKYTKLPTTVDAVQILPTNADEWRALGGRNIIYEWWAKDELRQVQIHTYTGKFIVPVKTWLIKDENGRLLTCHNYKFQEMYAPQET